MTRSLFRNRPLGKTLALLLSAVLVSQNVLPQTAYARQADVAIENHTSSSTQNKTVSNLRIDDVEKPQAGKELDGTARVTAAEGDTWDIPVMWVGDDMQLSTSAEEGRSYLPALAFFVPEGLALDGGTISVALSDSLAELFGTQDIISVYDATTGVTFILPASLRNFFARASQAQTAATDESLATETVASPASDNAALVAAPEDEAEPELAAEPEEEGEDEGEPDGKGAPDRLVDIFCAQTARNALSDEDLEWLINLILCRLQPQAVELLLNSFPAFRAGADKGEIGKEIGLYIYYQKGDDDGNSSHQTPPKVIAYVSGDVTKIDNNLKYAYMFAVDVNDLIKRDVKNNPVTNPATGKYVLLRDGDAMRTFENTIVHELFHAIMDDYNRTGMAGGTVMEEVYTPNNKFATPALQEKYRKIRYPKWFIEGTASAVENVYQFRYWYFQILRRLEGPKGTGTGDLNPSFTERLTLTNYINANYNNGYSVFFELPYSDMTQENGIVVDNSASRYVTGYLATLYLSTLAAQNLLNQRAAKYVNGTLTFDSSVMRAGLNTILERMHNGATLDSVIAELSPTENGVPVYKDADTFADLFIRGRREGNKYTVDRSSLSFVTDFLNYMLYVDSQLPQDIAANGSILDAFDKQYKSPLDPNKEASSNTLKVVNTNEMTPSTVKPDTINIGGGKTDPNAVKAASEDTSEGNSEPADPALPAAAKSEGDDANVTTDETTGDASETTGNDTGTTEQVPEQSEPVAEPVAVAEPEPVAPAASAPAAESVASAPEPTPTPTPAKSEQ